MKKILLLGAGIGQMPFLKICRAKGYEVLVVSPRGDYPGFKLADKAFFVDVRDKEAVLKIAAAEKIDAVLTDQADVSVPTVAYVAEKLNLRGIGYETALKFTDKYLMRKAAKAAGIAVPEFNQAFNLAEAVDIAEGMSYPLIIKPADSSGSRGVRRINSADDLKREFNSTKTFSMSGKVILERFIEGNVYCVNGYLMDNQYNNLDLGLIGYFDLPGMYIITSCVFSSVKRVTDRAGQRLLAENEKLVTSMKLPFGITHAEYIYNTAEDKVYLTEIAARGGGNYISSDLTTLATGFGTNEALIDYVVEGIVRKVELNKLDDKVSAYVDFGFPADGVVKSIAGLDDLKKIPGVYKVHMENCYVGEKVARLTDGTKRYGMILISADDEDECRKVIAKVKRTLVVEIETADGMKTQLW